MRFNISLQNGDKSFCRVTMPKHALWAENDLWRILLNGEEIDSDLIDSADYTILYFAFGASAGTVVIEGTDVVPEFTLPYPLLLLILFIAVFFRVRYGRKMKLALACQD